jgi:hypothetical protein
MYKIVPETSKIKMVQVSPKLMNARQLNLVFMNGITFLIRN